MNTVLFINATIGFSETFFSVFYCEYLGMNENTFISCQAGLVQIVKVLNHTTELSEGIFLSSGGGDWDFLFVASYFFSFWHKKLFFQKKIETSFFGKLYLEIGNVNESNTLNKKPFISRECAAKILRNEEQTLLTTAISDLLLCKKAVQNSEIIILPQDSPLTVCLKSQLRTLVTFVYFIRSMYRSSGCNL